MVEIWGSTQNESLAQAALERLHLTFRQLELPASNDSPQYRGTLFLRYVRVSGAPGSKQSQATETDSRSVFVMSRLQACSLRQC